MKFSIVLINYNGLSDTRECLRSIAAIGYSKIETIVVDNGSRSQEADAIAAEFDWVTVIASPENSGWSGGNNIGIRQALDPLTDFGLRRWQPAGHGQKPADVVLLLNNDTIVSPNIIKELQQAFDQGFEIVGPVINDYRNRDVIQTEGVRFNPSGSNEFFQVVHVDRVGSGTVTPVDIVNGCAIAIKRQVFERIGLIDDRFFLIGEESDFCLRAQTSGFHLGVLAKSLVFHKHSVSFARSGKPLQRYYGIRNLWLLVNRHSGSQGRRGLYVSRFAYLRHAYHRFCHERELGNESGADAISLGVVDAMLGRFGQQPIRATLLSRFGGMVASLVWRARGGRLNSNETLSQELS